MLMLMLGSPVLFRFPLAAPSSLGFSHRLSPSEDSEPWLGATQTRGVSDNGLAL